jgi:hypothetical protein
VGGELQELVADALGAPQAIGHRHRADQGDRRGREGRAVRRDRCARLPAPVPAEEVAMPAQQCGGLDDAERRAPGGEATGQEHEQRALGRGAARPFAAAMQDGKLVTEEGILRHQRRPAPREVAEGTRSGRIE